MIYPKTNFLKAIACLTALFFFSLGISFAAGDFNEWKSVQQIETGVEPHFLIHDSVEGIIHVFCVGADINYDGAFDEETDSKPTWCVIDLNSKTLVSEEKVEFDFGSFSYTNFRPAFNETERKMYIPNGTKVSVYDVDSYTLLEEIEVESTVAAVDVADGLIAVSCNPTYGENGRIYIYKDGEKVGDIEAGINTLDVFWVTSNMVLDNIVSFICNGPYGEDKGYYKEITLNDNYEVSYYDSLYVGQIPNALSEMKIVNGNFNARMPLIISNGSHRFDLFMMQEQYTGFVGTGGWSGPRQAVFSEDGIIVSTYNSDLRVIEGEEDPALTGIVKTAGKAEGVLFANNQLFVACQLDDYYGPMNIVEVFEHSEIETGDYTYYDVDAPKEQVAIVAGGEKFYTVNESKGITEINCNGSEFTSKLVYEFDMEFDCKPAYIEESNLLAIAGEGKLQIFKTDGWVNKIDEIDISHDILSVSAVYLEYMGSNVELISVIGNELATTIYFIDGSLQEHGTEDSENIIEMAMAEDENGFIYFDLYRNENGESAYLEISTDDEILKTIEGLSVESEIFIQDSILAVVDYDANTLSTFNIHADFAAIDVANLPFQLYSADLFSACKITQDGRLGFMSEGNICYYDFAMTSFTEVLPMTGDFLNDFAEFTKDEKQYIAGITDGSTVIYANGLYVAVIDDIESDFDAVSMYPNPVSENANVKVDLRNGEYSDITWQIFTVSGEVAGTGNISGAGNIEFNISASELNLNSGAYFLRLNSNGKSMHMIPFTVVK
jgi:hypothetical protein